jgi:hypothetical protein
MKVTRATGRRKRLSVLERSVGRREGGKEGRETKQSTPKLTHSLLLIRFLSFLFASLSFFLPLSLLPSPETLLLMLNPSLPLLDCLDPAREPSVSTPRPPLPKAVPRGREREERWPAATLRPLQSA